MKTTLFGKRQLLQRLAWCCLWTFALFATVAPATAQRLTLSELQAQIDALKARAATLEQQGAEQAEAVAEIQAQIDALTADLAALEQQTSDQGAAIADLQAAAAAVEAALFPPPCGGKCVFVTSTTHDGDLGGLAGGDAICNRLAARAGLPGGYKAWLSVDESSPDPISPEGPISPEDRFTKTVSPYRLVDGTTVAAGFFDLVDGSIETKIDVDENGATIGAPFEVWTGTQFDGTPSFQTCAGWTDGTAPTRGEEGDARKNSGEWTQASSPGPAPDCNNFFRLYCFQQ